MDDDALPLLMARWFEARLHDSVGFCLRGSRLYGLEVIDPDGLGRGEPAAARVSFIAEAEDRERVVRHPDALRVADFDAAVLVTVEWRPAAQARPARPGEFSGRRRARVVELLADGAAATVLRFENDPEYVVLAS